MKEYNIPRLLFVMALCTLFVWLAIFHWKRRRMYRLAAKIPGPDGYPIFGIGLQFIGDYKPFFKIIRNLFDTYPDIFKFWLGPKLMICLSNPEHLQVVMNHSQCFGKDPLYGIIMDMMGNGLVCAPVHIWKKNRKLINPAFHQKKLDSFVPVFTEHAKTFMKIMEKNAGNKNLDIFTKIFSFVMDSLCESTMGIRVDAQTSYNYYGDILVRITEIGMKRLLTVTYHSKFLFNFSKYAKEQNEILPKLKNFSQNVVVDRRKLFEEKMAAVENGEEIDDDINPKNFLDLLLQLCHKGAKFSDEQLRDEVDTFMSAGSDTTAETLSFCFLTMGIHQEIQKKLYDEVIDVLGEDRDITSEDLPKLKYMEMFIKETLRIFTPVPLISRTPSVDIDLDGITIPAHSSLALNVFHMHRNPKYYKEPLKFDPDRFLQDEVSKRHPYSFLPFSGGPRSCIAYKYATMKIKTILALVVRKFLVKSEYKSIDEVDILMTVVLRPTNGFKVSVELREQ